MKDFKENFLVGYRSARLAHILREACSVASPVATDSTAPPSDASEFTQAQRLRLVVNLKQEAVHVADLLEQRRDRAITDGDLDRALEQQLKLSTALDLVEQIDKAASTAYGIAWVPNVG